MQSSSHRSRRRALSAPAMLVAVLFAHVASAGAAAEHVDHQRHSAINQLLQHVPPKHHHTCRAILQGESFTFGQAWQDWYIFNNHFRDRLKWGDGVYVDIGTNHPTSISNTLFFDRCLGWRGVCFEPQTKYHAMIKSERNCTLVPRCVVGRGQSTAGHMQGIGGSAHLVLDGTSSSDAASSCVDATVVLPSILGHGTSVDLLSIDIEGFEAPVLQCFPFEEHSVKTILMETNFAQLREVDLFFHRHDYVNDQTFLNDADTLAESAPMRYTWLDNLYVKRAVPARLPPTSKTYQCDGAARAHRHGWCGGWVEWMPSDQSKYLRCNASAAS